MITISIDPVLVHLGSLAIRWYGLILIAVVFIGLGLTSIEVKRRGLPYSDLLSLAIYSLIVGIVGARLAHVIDRLDYFAANPMAIFSVQEGGLAVWGGIGGGLLFALLYSRYKKLPFLKLTDAAAPALALGAGLGRIACLINGDAWGAPTGENWGLVYTNPGAYLPADLLGVPTHPVPLYEFTWNLIAFGLLWLLRKRVQAPGTLFAIFVVIYSAGRVITTSWRQNEAMLFGLQEAQVISIVAILVAMPLLVYVLAKQSTASETTTA